MKKKYTIGLIIILFIFTLGITPTFAHTASDISIPANSSHVGLFDFIKNLFNFSNIPLGASVISVTKVSGGEKTNTEQVTNNNALVGLKTIINSISSILSPQPKQAYSATKDKNAPFKAYLSGTYGVKDFPRMNPVSIKGQLVTIHGHDFSKGMHGAVEGHEAEDGYTIQRFLREEKTGRIFYIEDIEGNMDLLPTMDVTLTGYALPIDTLKGKGPNKQSLVIKTSDAFVISSNQFKKGIPVKTVSSRRMKINSTVSTNSSNILKKVLNFFPKTREALAQSPRTAYPININNPPHPTTLPCVVKKAGPVLPSVRVLSPNGGESYPQGGTLNITWSTCNIPQNTPIQINVSQGTHNFPTANAINSDGQITIPIPYNQFVGNEYKVGVTTILSTNPVNTIVDYSDNYFSITNSSGCTNAENVYCGLVVLVDMSGGTANLPTPESLHETIFEGDVHDFYMEQTFGKVDYQGKVTDWISVPRVNPYYFNQAPGFLQEYLLSNSIDLLDYDQIIYLAINSIDGTSYASVGPWSFDSNGQTYQLSQAMLNYPSSDTINYFNFLDYENAPNDLKTQFEFIYAHETGHNLGAIHDNKWRCPENISIGRLSECRHIEYGNNYSIMGASSYFGNHFSGLSKSSFSSYSLPSRWLNSQNEIWVHGSQTIDIDPIETSSGNLLLIDFDNNMSPEYVIDARSSIGYDIPPTLFFNEQINVNLDGVFLYRTYIRNSSNSEYINSRVIDAHTTGIGGSTVLEDIDNVLSYGREFYDPALGVRVTAEKLTNGKFRVNMNYDLAPCAIFPPVIKKQRILGVDEFGNISISNADQNGMLYTVIDTDIYTDDYLNCYEQAQLINSISIDGQGFVSPDPNLFTVSYNANNDGGGYWFDFVIDTTQILLGSHTARLEIVNSQTGLSSSVDIPFTLVP